MGAGQTTLNVQRVAARRAFAALDGPVDDRDAVVALVEALDLDARAGRERQRVVAGLEHDAGGDLDLLARLDVVVGQVLQAHRREVDAVDPQATLVALGEVDDDLRLGEHLHGVGHRSDAARSRREAWLTSSPVTPRTTAQPISTSPTAIARLATASLRSIRRRLDGASVGRRLHTPPCMPVICVPRPRRPLLAARSAGASSLAPKDDRLNRR